MTRNIYQFHLKSTTADFVKEVESYYEQSEYAWKLNNINRQIPIGVSTEAQVFFEKYLVLSQEKASNWGDQRQAYYGSFQNVLDYYDDLNLQYPVEYFVIHISMNKSEAEELLPKMNRFKQENPIDSATEIIVQAAAIHDGGALALYQLLGHLCTVYNDLEEQIDFPVKYHFTEPNRLVNSELAPLFFRPSLPSPEYDGNKVISIDTLKAYFPDANEQMLNDLQLTQKLWDVQRLTFSQIDQREDISRATFQRRKSDLQKKGLLSRKR